MLFDEIVGRIVVISNDDFSLSVKSIDRCDNSV